jgi:putative ABC transport system permease protein
MISQSIKMAWNSITSNKMRSFLTMLGIIIGVASLIVLVSIADGATGSVTDSISSMGTNLLTVSIQDDKENPLRLSELSDFVDEETIRMAAPYAQTSVTAKSGYTSDAMTVYGTTGAYYDIQGLSLQNGRWMNKADVDNRTYVVILNAYAATQLIGRTNCVGESISLDGKKYQIIGVLQDEQSGISSTQSERMEAYIPYTSLTRLSDSVLYVTTFYAASADENSMDAAESYLTQKMLERFGNDEDAFTIVNQSAVMETMESVTNTLAWMLGGIAAISLVVGGIGILKVAGMFVSDMSFSISPQVTALAVGFSAFIGIVFGIYPAWKAARKHLIDALRYSG